MTKLPCLDRAGMATSNHVGQTRLKSSFIYLANAVNDLRGNWATLAAVLAPLVILGALCLLPDALNLQHAVAEKFAPGTHNILWTPVQEPYSPSADEVKPLFASWVVTLFHVALLLITLVVNLVVLCMIRRVHAGVRRERVLNEALEVYREALKLAPGFYWITFLQLVVLVFALTLWRMSVVGAPWLTLLLDLIEVIALIFGGLLYLWLYFAQYALVFDDKHSFHSLLFSRDLMRKRFFRVAIRIGVFLALWSGYNSWAAGCFVIMSVILGPVGLLTGYLLATIFIVDLAAVSVTYVTAAFFVAAGVRLYRDLLEFALEPLPQESVVPPPAPLPSLTA